MNLSDVIALTRDIRQRVRDLARFAVLTLVDDTTGLQSAQVSTLAGETRSGAHLQEYGLQSVPFEGAEAVALALGGDKAHTVIICVDDRRYRLKNMEQGEVALYTDQGDYVWIKRDGHLVLHASTDVTIDAPSATFTGDLTVDGALTVQKDLAVSGAADVTKDLTVNGAGGIAAPHGDMNSMGTVLHSHVHTGVMSGGAVTGPPV